MELRTAAPIPQPLITKFAAIVGADHCISRPDQLLTYECDALTSFHARPGLVVLPASTAEVVEVVKLARAVRLPIVPRGSGTGLSGGALPVPGCILLGLSRMKRILEVDLDNQFVRVEPGVINLEITKRISPNGYYYAPDPSSQQVCTIGGNVAENSGGAHCLKYGFTTNHVLGAKVVLGDGSVIDLGGPVLDLPGYDLRGVLVGSEGTLCIVTEVVLRILRKPEATRTFFATFPSTTEAGHAVSYIIAAGIVPAAIEMMDRLAIVAIKAATGVDWPDVGAALLMDVDGTAAEVEHTAAQATELARKAGALEIRVPRDAAERETMWRGRRSAFAAVGLRGSGWSHTALGDCQRACGGREVVERIGSADRQCVPRGRRQSSSPRSLRCRGPRSGSARREDGRSNSQIVRSQRRIDHRRARRRRRQSGVHGRYVFR